MKTTMLTKSWIFRAATALVVAAALGAPQLASAQAGKTLQPHDSFKNGTYVNHDFNFQVSIPKKGWMGIDDPRLPNVIFVAMKEPKDKAHFKEGVDFNPNITLGVEIVPDGIDTPKYAAAATHALEVAGWQLLEEKAITWSGQQGYEIKAQRLKDNVALLQRFTVLDNGAVVIAATARPAQMKTVEKEFQQIFGSFKVNPKKTNHRRPPKKRGKRGG